jgi:hypothetical protein
MSYLLTVGIFLYSKKKKREMVRQSLHEYWWQFVQSLQFLFNLRFRLL